MEDAALVLCSRLDISLKKRLYYYFMVPFAVTCNHHNTRGVINFVFWQIWRGAITCNGWRCLLTTFSRWLKLNWDARILYFSQVCSSKSLAQSFSLFIALASDLLWVSLSEPVIHLLFYHYIGLPEYLAMQKETILVLFLDFACISPHK
jgi:hypothetical protein